MPLFKLPQIPSLLPKVRMRDAEREFQWARVLDNEFADRYEEEDEGVVGDTRIN